MKRKADAAYFKGKYEIEMFMMKCFLLPSFDMHLQLEYSSQKRLVNELRTFMLLLFAQKNRLLTATMYPPPTHAQETNFFVKPHFSSTEAENGAFFRHWTPFLDTKKSDQWEV